MMRYKNSFRSLLGATLALLGAATAVQAQTAPANDNFANAQVLTAISGTVNGSNVRATRENGEPNHVNRANGNSIWYRYVAPNSGNVAFSTANSTFDTVMSVYRGNRVDSLTLITQNDDSGNSLTSAVIFPVTARSSYYIAVDSYVGSATGAVSLTWRLTNPPANDNFSSAVSNPAFTLNGVSDTKTGNNTDATPETGEPNHAGLEPFYSIWYKWSPTTSGSVTITTQGSAVDTVLAAYLGSSVGTLTEVKSNDDVSNSIATSAITFQAQANAIYYIAVDSYDEGDITINLNQIVGSPTRYTVSGNVKTSNGQGLGGVIISLNGSTEGNRGTSATTTTNDAGAYNITNILAGSYTLVATKRGYTMQPASSNITVGTANSVDNNFTATLIPIPKLPDVSVSNVSIREGNKGDSYMSFNVSLSKASSDIIAVGYTTENVTATAGSDYKSISGNLLFPAGTVTLSVKVKLIPDTRVEANETFNFRIVGATGANVLDSVGVGTIINDDASSNAASAPSARTSKAPEVSPRRVRLARLFPR